MRVSLSVVPIPLSGIDVPASSECIWFCPKASRAEVDDEVELGEELGPAGLVTSQDLRSGEVLKVFVVSDNIDRGTRPLQVMSPVAEGLVDGKELLIVGVIVEFRSGEGMRVECDGAELSVGAGDRKDASDGIVGSVGLDCDRNIRHPMGEDRSGGECLLQGVEGGVTVVREVPWSILAHQVC